MAEYSLRIGTEGESLLLHIVYSDNFDQTALLMGVNKPFEKVFDFLANYLRPFGYSEVRTELTMRLRSSRIVQPTDTPSTLGLLNGDSIYVVPAHSV